ncbi:MAG: hypothetical protein RLY20_1340 [Verrucomicrobiota bacterium]
MPEHFKHKPNMIGRRFLLLLFIGLSAQLSGAAPLLEENFAYPTGALNAQGNWSGGSGAQVISGSLSYPGLQSPSVTSNKASLPSTAATVVETFNATSISNGSVYLSFILKQTTLSASTTGGTVAGLDDDGAVTTSNGKVAAALGIHIKQTNSTSYLVGIRKGQGASGAGGGADVFYTGASFGTNDVVFIVAKYTFGPGAGDDTVTLWVNPPTNSFAGVEPAPSVAATTTTNTVDAAELQYVFLRCNSSTTSGVNEVDDLRVGTTWADVTPTDGPAAPTPVPVITQALVLPQGVVLRGTNGVPSGVYQVLASTNVTVPVANWPSIAGRAFDANGNFDSTNPVASGQVQQFFRLLVGGTLSPNPTAPSITNSPQSLTLAVGQTANFLVGASGTAPLDYFWSLNTNTPVGGNSSTLTLLSITTNDAGAYRVIVSNSLGTATSAVATLTVLVPPTITSDPTNLTVAAGGLATFNATATGSAPLRYQWYFNTNTTLANATNSSFSLGSAQATNAGTYSVIVTNAVGSATSAVATLTVLAPPSITVQPLPQSVTLSNPATFSVTAAGAAPLTYLWRFNTNTPVGANSNGFTIATVLSNNVGNYSVIVTNNYGAVTSVFAALSLSTPVTNFSRYNLMGFGKDTTGGGMIAETSAAYAKVTNALSLANAIDSATVKVIEIMNDLDLGWLEIGAAAQAVGPFRTHATPLLHPRLLQTGISLLDIQSKDGLTIFSANGSTIKHCCFNIKNARNVIVRNLKFDELWEWDEATKGNYDKNDWDFIDLGNGGGTGTTTNIWIDHCTFTKTYDGIVDIKGGANHITFSWNKYVGDDGATNPNSFVWQQINTLESNKASYAMYNSLRTSSGFTPAEIVTIIQGQDKTHLAGANDGVGNAGNAAENALISITFHHQWFQNCWDRCVPRLRAGNVHNFNIYADTSLALDAQRLRDAHGVNSSYNFNPPLNGSIATEGGAILVENSIYQDCKTPLRNNQTDTNNPAYTGKIMALNSLYSFRTTGGTTNTYFGDSTNAPGTTYFGPVQAPVIPFSWNQSGGVLPYSYTMDDPNQLKAILTDPSSGVGAGVLTWGKTNWLKTSY